jgi:hypothetical protein
LLTSSRRVTTASLAQLAPLRPSSLYRLSDDQIAGIQGSGAGHFRYQEPNYNICSSIVTAWGVGTDTVPDE